MTRDCVTLAAHNKNNNKQRKLPRIVNQPVLTYFLQANKEKFLTTINVHQHNWFYNYLHPLRYEYTIFIHPANSCRHQSELIQVQLFGIHTSSFPVKHVAPVFDVSCSNRSCLSLIGSYICQTSWLVWIRTALHIHSYDCVRSIRLTCYISALQRDDLIGTVEEVLPRMTNQPTT